MKPGLQFLQFASFDFSSDPEFPQCEQAGIPKQGKRIETFLMLRRVDDQWVATLAPGQPHSVTLAFRYSGQRVGGRYGIAGTIHGEMQDADVNEGGIFVPASDVRVRITASGGSGPATVDGFAQPSGTLVLLDGRVLGRLRYSTVAGDDANDCPSAHWSLQNVR